VFLVNVPVVLVALTAMVRIVPDIPRSGASAARRLDPVGIALSVLGLLGIVYGVIRAGHLGHWTSPSAVLPLVAGLVLLAVFGWWELHVAHPALNVRYFRERRFVAAAVGLGVVYFALLGGTFVITFYLQAVRGYGPLRAGVCLLPLAFSLIIFAPRAPKVVRRFGARTVSGCGLAAIGLSLLGLALIGRDSSIWVFVCCLLVFGAGSAHVVPPSTEAIVSALPSDQSGMASAVNNTFRQIGASLGAAVLGSVLNAAYRARLDTAVADLPAPHAQQARGSVSATFQVAQGLPAGRADALAKAAEESFLYAMRITWLVAAMVAVLAAALVFQLMPDRTSTEP
jgi:Na+/melibiose symporter-like transporter